MTEYRIKTKEVSRPQKTRKTARELFRPAKKFSVWQGYDNNTRPKLSLESLKNEKVNILQWFSSIPDINHYNDFFHFDKYVL